MKKVSVSVSKTYTVHIAPGLLTDCRDLLAPLLAGKTAAIVTDDTVNTLYAPQLEAQLAGLGCPFVKFVIPHGEKSKNIENYCTLLNFLAENHLTRTDLILALGGGVVGDLAGFAAASYLRGIGFVQLPTTLLAAVDSSVGGKTGIDLAAGKNLAGAFHQPALVLCDYSALDTLPEAIFRDGMAEVIKYGAICDRALLLDLAAGTPPDMESLIARCVAIKRDIVEQDERESGVRKLLNFGHTVGHAIEKCSGYSISHGFAVSAGMSIVTRAAIHAGHCPPECGSVLQQALSRYALPCTTGFSAEMLCSAMLSDKKRHGGAIDLIVPSALGHCTIQSIGVEALCAFLSAGLDE